MLLRPNFSRQCLHIHQGAYVYNVMLPGENHWKLMAGRADLKQQQQKQSDSSSRTALYNLLLGCSSGS